MQPAETREGRKLGGCLGRQGVEAINQLGMRRYATPECVGVLFLHEL